MPVTAEVLGGALRAVGAGNRLVRPLPELAAGADAALRQAPPGLTEAGAASWMATQLMEGDYGRATKEYAKNPPYAPWVGRTFEMLTHQEAYERFGAWCKAHGLVPDAAAFVKAPAALEDYRWAWLGGVFYFEWRDLWPIANRGDHLLVSRIVNAGPGWKRLGANWLPHGWEDRRRMFDALRRAGPALLPGGAPAVAETGALPSLAEGDESELVWKLATWLNRTFPAYARINAGGAPPCRLGPQCIAAMTEFQRRSNIPTAPPFGWGAKSWAAATALGFRP